MRQLPAIRAGLGGRSVLRAMVRAAGLMLGLSVCALVGGWLFVLAFGEDRAGPGDPGSPVQIGQPAPDFTLYSLDETPHALSDQRGAPVALNFWAMWCLPCKLELGALNEAHRAGRESGLRVIGVDVRERPSDVIAYAAEEGIEYLVLLDPHGSVADSYGVSAMPTTIWIDADGLVRAVDKGIMTGGRVRKALTAMEQPLVAPTSVTGSGPVGR